MLGTADEVILTRTVWVREAFVGFLSSLLGCRPRQLILLVPSEGSPSRVQRALLRALRSSGWVVKIRKGYNTEFSALKGLVTYLYKLRDRSCFLIDDDVVFIEDNLQWMKEVSDKYAVNVVVYAQKFQDGSYTRVWGYPVCIPEPYFTFVRGIRKRISLDGEPRMGWARFGSLLAEQFGNRYGVIVSSGLPVHIFQLDKFKYERFNYKVIQKDWSKKAGEVIYIMGEYNRTGSGYSK